MSLIDQAFSKVYQQTKAAASPPTRESSVTATAAPGASRELLREDSRSRTRELYVHQPQVALRGLHAPASSTTTSTGAAPHISAQPTASPPADAMSLTRGEEHENLSTLAGGRTTSTSSQAGERDTVAWGAFCFEVHALPDMDHVDETVRRLDRSLIMAPSAVQEVSRERIVAPTTPEPESTASLSTTEAPAESPIESPIESLLPATSRQPVAPVHFAPAWEVDRFQLPLVCQQVRQLLGRDLELALRSLHDPRPQVLWVSSIWPGEGRTTVAVVLAATLGACGFRTLLMQGDCRTTPLAQQLGIAADDGWTPRDADASAEKLSDVSIASVADRLTLLSASSSPVGLSDCLASACSIADRLAPWFDFVVVDAPAGDNLLPRSMLGDRLVEILVQDVRRQPRDAITPYRSMPSGSPLSARIVRNFSA